MSPSNNMGQKLKQLRQNKHLTQAKLADQLHVSRQTISSWETQRNHPDLNMIQTIAAFYEVPIESLITGTKRKPVLKIDAFLVWSCLLVCLILERLTQATTVGALYWFDILIVWIIGMLVVSSRLSRWFKIKSNVFSRLSLVLFGLLLLIGELTNLFSMGFGLMVTSIFLGGFSIIGSLLIKN